MRTSLNLVDDIQIASPCPARWESMTGDDDARHCKSCDKTVYDLSRLTAERAADLIREKEGSLCVRLYRRRDGRVLTADCPVGLREKLQRLRHGMSGTLFGALVAVGVCVLFAVLTLLRLGRSDPFGGAVMGEACPPPGQPGVAPGPERLPMPREDG